MNNLHFFSRQMDSGVYLISAKEWIQEKSTVNCWLITGDTKALLLDAGMPCKGLKDYVQSLIGSLPLMLALTHGHFDHAGAIDEFVELWMHEDDTELLNGKNGLPASPFHGMIHTLDENDVIDLGNRSIQVWRIQGHTKGSLVFLDTKTHILFSGDSVARRGFFTEPHTLPLSVYFDDLLKIEALDFDKVASCHDSFFLDKTQISYFIRECITGIEHPDGHWNMGTDSYLSIHRGVNVNDPKYLSISILETNTEEIKKDVQSWIERHPDYLSYHTLTDSVTFSDLETWNETKEFARKLFACRDTTWAHFRNAPVNNDIFGYFYNRIRNNQRLYYSFYTPEETSEDPSKKETGFFFSPTDKENAPFVLLIPGGGYQSVCTFFESFSVTKQLNDAGYHVFSLIYRVRETNLMPKPLNDAKAAINYILNNRNYFKVNDRYAVIGFSAGAHIAGLLSATTFQIQPVLPKAVIL
ncbi:MAG: MBL fold metallo-hydrolase, partial [Erysipelotrichaceae bacterium]|nr:MBL fold metallo-hydrolase [Erysipelotrichaceae bacterium]